MRLFNVAVDQLDVGVVTKAENFASVFHILHHQSHLVRVLVSKNDKSSY